MAEVGKKKRISLGNYCVAGGPNSTRCKSNSKSPGISMHYFPKDKTLRQKWVRFVRTHRRDYVPAKTATLCSVHFDENCFNVPVGLSLVDTHTGKSLQPQRVLIKGSCPTKVVSSTSPLTARKRRMIIRDLLAQYDDSSITTKQPKTSKTTFADDSLGNSQVPMASAPVAVPLLCSRNPSTSSSKRHKTSQSSQTEKAVTLTDDSLGDSQVSMASSPAQLHCSPDPSTSTCKANNVPNDSCLPTTTATCCSITSTSSALPTCTSSLTQASSTRCTRCEKNNRKRKNLERKVQRLRKKVEEMQEKLKLLQ